MDHSQNAGSKMNGYLSLALQTLIGAVIMYLVMFVMIDSLDSFYNNLNMLYMTLMMVAPMVVLMILAMKHMFASRSANLAIIVVSVAVFFGSFALIRSQTTIDDVAFLRSMIPHHSGAILMCREANLRDAEVKRLCGEIRNSQRREIEQMKVILVRLN
ncbi:MULTISPECIES: DUF305 domain-containing protein [Sphingomonadales]|jgi:uncharacterized protein (DUF305 family)|uniref:DUF305 domain-containing protein n=1 Tax=Sphingomonadales TaxID=204457 RepID=UPI0008249430|nr:MULTISPECIES: DUF305 domain-containing protein [Sphingomonadales]MAF59916.1 DUF305 domain-containing protein [Blastomonas sp.]|tara:strand:- start:125 stop:598 length:474 start_codon:yes stop_codon:yes gene_type:complete